MFKVLNVKEFIFKRNLYYIEHIVILIIKQYI